MQRTIIEKSTSLFLAFVLSFSVLFAGLGSISPAYADEISDLQAQIAQATEDHTKALEKAFALEQQITENTKRIEEIEEELPEQQEKSNDATVALYKLNQEGLSLIDMILGAQTLQEFLTSIDYVTSFQQKNLKEINRLNALKEELDETEESLVSDKEEAEAEKKRAEEALLKTEDKLAQAEMKKAEADAAAALADEAAQQEEEQAADSGDGEGANSGGSGGSGGSSGGSGGAANPEWPSDKAAFVDMWSGRINSYLSGSPLSGYGRNFAEAAWNYGVDPRWSPAISNTESSKGLYCYRPYNAWGWGGISWGSWEESIDAHVRGLANGYGYTISEAAAQKYCPGGWENWYSKTLNQMNMI